MAYMCSTDLRNIPKMFRVIPIVLVKNERVFQSIGFRDLIYLGDPQNTLSIFSQLPVDEIVVLNLDGLAKDPSLAIYSNSVFIPVGYGGGIDSIDKAHRVFSHGFEKIILRSGNLASAAGIEKLSNIYGNSAISIKLDYNWINGELVVEQNRSRSNHTIQSFFQLIKNFCDSGVGEILLTDIARVGTWKGADWLFGEECQSHVSVPIIINGGVRSDTEIADAMNSSLLGGVGIGSLFSFSAPSQGVLIHIPPTLEILLEQRR